MKRIIIGTLAAFAVLVVGIVVAFQVSPLPGVFLIRTLFDHGDRTAMAALEKHLPPGISERLDLAYGAHPDEVFDIFYPENTASPLPAIIWVHGGAWVAGSKESVGNYLRILSGHGYATIAVGYTLAPNATYPAQIRQVIAAIDHAIENAGDLNIDPTRIILAGDSAGAQLAAQAALIVTSPDYAVRIGIATNLPPNHLIAAVLFCGAFDLSLIDTNGSFGTFLRPVLWALTGHRDFTAAPGIETASIPNFVTPDFPPTFISGGNGDSLTPHSLLLAEKLSQQGVAVEALFFAQDHAPALPHEYQRNLDSPEGQLALERLLDFLTRHLESAPASHQSP